MREGIDGRVDEMIDAMLAALTSKADEVGAEPHEMFMAATSLSVRLSLGVCKTPDYAKKASAALMNDYYSQMG